ncbi:MAG: hypothetical protein C4289_04910, partial [Chloroflexota bacterium]
REPTAAADAVEAVRGKEVGAAQVEVLTDAPYPPGTFGEDPVPHRLYVFPFVGAACGFIVGLLVTAGTQLSYPLVTGGKPLLAWPAMLVILYEGTMLGAILFTIAGMLFESRLPAALPRVYDPRISEGYIGVLVRLPHERTEAAQEALRRAGATDVIVESPRGRSHRG